jgi:predicted MFS family arabinose efflux permease
VISAAFTLAFLSLLPVYFSTDLVTVTIALSLAFLFTEVSIAPMWLVTMDVAPRYSGTAGGFLALAFSLSGILSPTIFGYMVDLTGDWHGPFVISIGLLVVGAVVAFWMRPDQQFIPATFLSASSGSAAIQHPSQ